MKINSYLMRRRQLDGRLATLRKAIGDDDIRMGTIKAIRESLGMSLESLGKRLGVSRATAHQLERAEADESITIRRLRAAAEAIECDLFIAIVPRRSLEDTVRDRAYALAKREVARVDHSMVLEAQATYASDRSDLVRSLAEEMIERNDPRIWQPD